MNWNTFVQIVKDLLFNYKLSAEPHTAYTPIETIDFPNTYKVINPTIPDRQDNMFSGSEFGQSILNIPATQQRDDAIIAQCAIGNLPNWMRTFKEVVITEKGNTLTYFIAPDVLCIGNDSDFLRVSLNGYSARQVVDMFNCMLPTKKMSDQIWRAANLKMNPIGMGASTHMTNTQTLIDHNRIIEQQRAGRNFNIIAGIKKDIIFYSPLITYRNNICIYGWHYPNSGQPIQGAQYIAHNIMYQDYSHSIRLINRGAILNGKNVDLMDVLNNQQYSYLINDELAPYNATSIYER
jgi:hypothetical protein